MAMSEPFLIDKSLAFEVDLGNFSADLFWPDKRVEEVFSSPRNFDKSTAVEGIDESSFLNRWSHLDSFVLKHKSEEEEEEEKKGTNFVRLDLRVYQS